MVFMEKDGWTFIFSSFNFGIMKLENVSIKMSSAVVANGNSFARQEGQVYMIPDKYSVELILQHLTWK
jgi:hypothetical protein